MEGRLYKIMNRPAWAQAGSFKRFDDVASDNRSGDAYIACLRPVGKSPHHRPTCPAEPCGVYERRSTPPAHRR
jgi:hypothetical protein